MKITGSIEKVAWEKKVSGFGKLLNRQNNGRIVMVSISGTATVQLSDFLYTEDFHMLF